MSNKLLDISVAAIERLGFQGLPIGLAFATGGDQVKLLITALLKDGYVRDPEHILQLINKEPSMWYVPQGGPGQPSGHGLLNIRRKTPSDIFRKAGMEYGWELDLGEDEYDQENSHQLYFGFDKNGKFIAILYAEWIKEDYAGEDDLMIYQGEIPMDKAGFLKLFSGDDGILQGLYGRYGPWDNWKFIDL